MRKCTSNVSIFLKFLLLYKQYLYQCIRSFKAGCLSQHISAWEEITSDQEVLQTVQGMKLEFEESPFQGECSGFEIPKNQSLIQVEVNKLLKKGVVAIYIDDIIAIDQSYCGRKNKFVSKTGLCNTSR